MAALATYGRGHRTFRRGGRNSSLVSPSLRRPLSKSACLIKTSKLCADTLAPYSATVGLIVEPRLGSYPHSAVQVLASARRSCIQLVASRPVRWSGPRAPARWRAAGVSWFLDAPAGLEASSIRAAVSWIGTTVKPTKVVPTVVLDRHAVKRSAQQPSCRVQSSDHGAPQRLNRRLRWRTAAWRLGRRRTPRLNRETL